MDCPDCDRQLGPVARDCPCGWKAPLLPPYVRELPNSAPASKDTARDAIARCWEILGRKSRVPGEDDELAA